MKVSHLLFGVPLVSCCQPENTERELEREREKKVSEKSTPDLSAEFFHTKE
jgi:hypothetical protein